MGISKVGHPFSACPKSSHEVRIAVSRPLHCTPSMKHSLTYWLSPPDFLRVSSREHVEQILTMLPPSLAMAQKTARTTGLWRNLMAPAGANLAMPGWSATSRKPVANVASPCCLPTLSRTLSQRYASFPILPHSTHATDQSRVLFTWFWVNSFDAPSTGWEEQRVNTAVNDHGD